MTNSGSTSSADRVHAEYSPSSLKYRAHCHYWRSDDRGPTPWGEEGNLLHFLSNPSESLDALDPEQKKMVTEVRDCIEPYLVHPHEWEPKIPVLDQWGFADLLCFPDREHAILFDFKFGLWDVDPPADNLQIQAYVLGVLRQHPSLQKVTSIILQPRTGTALAATYSRDEDAGWLEARIGQIIANAKNPTVFRKGDGCLWCGFKSQCPELLKTGLDIARRYAPELEDLHAVGWHSSQIDSNRTAFVALEYARIMSGWAEAVRENITKATMEGHLAPAGYALTSRRGNAEGIKGSIAYTALEGISGAPPPMEEFLESCKVSLPDLIQIARTRAPRGKKGLVEDALVEKLNQLGLINRSDEIIYLRRIKNFLLPPASPEGTSDITILNTHTHADTTRQIEGATAHHPETDNRTTAPGDAG